MRLIPWLDSVRADLVFGCRQLAKNKATSAAAILSLGLAIGACTSAFRLIDAVLLRPLPVSIRNSSTVSREKAKGRMANRRALSGLPIRPFSKCAQR